MYFYILKIPGFQKKKTFVFMHTAKFLKTKIFFYTTKKTKKYICYFSMHFGFNNQFIKVMRTWPIFQKKNILFCFNVWDYEFYT